MSASKKRQNAVGVTSDNRGKSGPTPKRPARNRPVSTRDLAYFSAGLRTRPFRRCLNGYALHDAMQHASLAELEAIAAETETEQLKQWCDVFAARYPDDARWQSWRDYRRFEASHAN